MFIEHPLCARPYARGITYITIFTPYESKDISQMHLMIRKLRARVVKLLFKVTKLTNSDAKM